MIVPSLYFFDSLVGENAGIWLKGYCMRWNGGAWEPIPMSADGNFETNPYVAALMDLTEGAPTGTFMSILVRDLIAKTAMIERIFSHKIRIQKIGNDEGAIYGGDKYDQNGNDTDPDGRLGKAGFYAGTDGRLKGGDVKFNNGEFNNIRILGNSFFEGDILSGPLELNDRNPSNQGEIKFWPQGASTKGFFEYATSRYGWGPIPTNGTYGSISFSFFVFFRIYKDWIGCVLYDKDMNNLTADQLGNPQGSSPFQITDNYYNYKTLELGNLQIGFYNPAGKTIKLNNLPLNEPALTGAIWQDSSGYLRIKR
jgi:hypothetical protein